MYMYIIYYIIYGLLPLVVAGIAAIIIVSVIKKKRKARAIAAKTKKDSNQNNNQAVAKNENVIDKKTEMTYEEFLKYNKDNILLFIQQKGGWNNLGQYLTTHIHSERMEIVDDAGKKTVLPNLYTSKRFLSNIEKFAFRFLFDSYQKEKFGTIIFESSDQYGDSFDYLYCIYKMSRNFAWIGDDYLNEKSNVFIKYFINYQKLNPDKVVKRGKYFLTDLYKLFLFYAGMFVTKKFGENYFDKERTPEKTFEELIEEATPSIEAAKYMFDIINPEDEDYDYLYSQNFYEAFNLHCDDRCYDPFEKYPYMDLAERKYVFYKDDDCKNIYDPQEMFHRMLDYEMNKKEPPRPTLM